MDQAELGRALGRLEEGIKGIDKKLDDTMVPAIKSAHRRIDKIERLVYVVTGAFLMAGSGIIVARELLVAWLKKKMGLPV